MLGNYRKIEFVVSAAAQPPLTMNVTFFG